MHVTQAALNKVKTHLETTLPDFESRIWRRRQHQLHDRELPAIIIQYDGERVSEPQAARTSMPIQRRDVNFSVIVADKVFEKTERGSEGEALEDRILEHVAKIETSMLENQQLEGRDIHELTLSDIEIGASQDSDRPLGSARLVFTMSLRTHAGHPQNFI